MKSHDPLGRVHDLHLDGMLAAWFLCTLLLKAGMQVIAEEVVTGLQKNWLFGVGWRTAAHWEQPDMLGAGCQVSGVKRDSFGGVGANEAGSSNKF